MPFPRLAWREAMERFGVDKPDLRFGLEIADLSALVAPGAAAFIQDAVAAGGRLRGIVMPGGAGLIRARRLAEGWEGQGVKAVGPATLAQIDAADGALLLAVSGPDNITSPALHAVRTELCRRPDARPLRAHAFAWVTDFPLFERDAETGAYVPAHHPFTAPHPDDAGRLESDPASCRALHYDAVYNGNELGSGSIRITDPALQGLIFRPVSYTHLRAHETPEHLVCRLLLEKK